MWGPRPAWSMVTPACPLSYGCPAAPRLWLCSDAEPPPLGGWVLCSCSCLRGAGGLSRCPTPGAEQDGCGRLGHPASPHRDAPYKSSRVGWADVKAPCPTLGAPQLRSCPPCPLQLSPDPLTLATCRGCPGEHLPAPAPGAPTVPFLPAWSPQQVPAHVVVTGWGMSRSSSGVTGKVLCGPQGSLAGMAPLLAVVGAVAALGTHY